MNNLSQEELALIAIIRDLKPYENIEIKKSENGEVVYTYTRKDRYILLTMKT